MATEFTDDQRQVSLIGHLGWVAAKDKAPVDGWTGKVFTASGFGTARYEHGQWSAGNITLPEGTVWFWSKEVVRTTRESGGQDREVLRAHGVEYK